MADLSKHLDFILEIPVSGYVAPSPGGRGTLFRATPEALRVSIVRDAWAVSHSFENWLRAAAESSHPVPLFEWESISTFRPDDPIIIVQSGDAAQAMMQLKEGYAVPCPLGKREEGVYVSFLEVAPWNHTQSSPRLLRGLGQLLLRLACERSEQLGYGGSIGLHALPNAEGFYKRLGFQSPICPNEYREVYFELDRSGVQAFLDREA